MILLLQLVAAADTVLVRNVPPARTAFEQVVFVASGLTSIVLFLGICILLVALLVLKSKADELQVKLDALLLELRPMARNATAMAEDVRAVAQNLNAMVGESRETVKVVNERVRTSMVRLSDHVDDLSALVGRVNKAAERVATVATTTVAGIKMGARVFGLGKKGKKKRAANGERPKLRRHD